MRNVHLSDRLRLELQFKSFFIFFYPPPLINLPAFYFYWGVFCPCLVGFLLLFLFPNPKSGRRVETAFFFFYIFFFFFIGDAPDNPVN